METIELVVAQVRDETPRVRSYLLQRPDGGPLPAFEAGAHVDVIVADAQRKPLLRSYSLCGQPGAQGAWRLGVLREDAGRGGSLAVHRGWQPGMRVRCSPPKNHFPLATLPLARDAQHLLVAGGIGITPLLAMARALQAAGENWTLHYAARSRADAAFVSELEQINANRLRLHFDGGDPSRGLDVGTMLAQAAPASHVYVCGPRGLNEVVIAAAGAAGWARERVHHEFFSAAAPAAGDGGFTVRLQASGRSVTVGADESVLDALLREGVEPLYDCRRGECGLCATTVVSGDIDHRDYVLSEGDRAQGRQMCICVSRVRGGELVLDL
jgi:vanillate O-demethylase ferredoxin subunit